MLVGIVGAAARTRGEERAVLRRGGQRTDVRACTLLLEWPARWRSVRRPDTTEDTMTMAQTHEPTLLEDILGDEQEHADERAGWLV